MTTDEAVAHYGSKIKLARALGCSPSAISLWGNRVPPLRQHQIQNLTGGALKLDPELRPILEQSSSTQLRFASGPIGSVCPSSTPQASS